MTTRSMRLAALAGGIFYLITFASSIPAAVLQQAALADGSYVTGAGQDAALAFSGILDVITALAGIGSAVALFSVVKREHEGLALGFVATRSLEAAMLGVGALMAISLVTLRQAAAASVDPTAFVPAGSALVAMQHWTTVLGPGMASFNALMLGTALYRSGLVPRAIPALGLVGAPMFIAFVAGTILGVTETGSVLQGIAVAPFFIWELAVGLWMTFKGFRPSAPIVRAATQPGALRAQAGAA